MKQIMMPLLRELCEYVFHPIRMIRLSKINNMDLDDYLDLY